MDLLKIISTEAKKDKRDLSNKEVGRAITKVFGKNANDLHISALKTNLAKLDKHHKWVRFVRSIMGAYSYGYMSKNNGLSTTLS